MISVQCGPNSIVRHSTPVCRTGMEFPVRAKVMWRKPSGRLRAENATPTTFGRQPSRKWNWSMRETMSAKGTIRRLTPRQPLIEVVHRAPASRVARWLTGGPCVEARLPQSADAGWFDLCRVASSSRSLHTIGVAIMQRRTRSAQPEEGVEIT